MHASLRLALLSIPLALAACSAPKPDISYVDPGAQGSIAGTGLESQDIASASAKAAQSIVNVPQIASAAKPPTILIKPVTNTSSSPIDTSLYTTKLRGSLMNNTGGKVRFLAPNTGPHDPTTYDYILTAELQGIAMSGSKGQSDYFLVSFQLVGKNDMLLWENQYEIKKEGKESAVYR